MIWFQMRVWPARWVLLGGAFALVGILTNDLRAMIVGFWLLLDQRVKQTQDYLDLQVLQVETRLATGTTRVWVRHDK